MVAYVDTSFVVALFTNEASTKRARSVLAELQQQRTTLYSASITPVEWTSAVWKKVRTGALTESSAEELVELIAHWGEQLDLIDVNAFRLERAERLIRVHWQRNLRSLDAIQLSCALSVFERDSVALTHDALLGDCFRVEGFSVLP